MWILPLLIIIIPVVVLSLKIGAKQGWRWRIFGAVAGLTIVPISYGMNIAAYYVPFTYGGKLLAITGFLLFYLHGTPGYQLGIWLGIFRGNEVISSGAPLYYSLLLSTIFWIVTYGGFGYFLDVKQSKNKSTMISV
ncbi:hypothetical protein H8K38_17425 [Undibacterium sp. FT79W]|uniref:hypothetical protein n=1 Tax=Undibacterium sp. FT79W TaxID=2762296 RepID=UPI00164C1E86|nr:hypothetical protein [Undibacterium sp. FT79W]MBC3879593.1 hypothetical protein [Undibacterium sp. FT79W]